MKNTRLLIFLLYATIFNAYAQIWKPKMGYATIGTADGALSFTIQNRIFVGGGIDSKEFYEYIPETDSWTRKADIPGVNGCRAFGIGFSINGKGYAGMGLDIKNGTATCKKDLWEYDPVADSWKSKAGYPGIACDAYFCFVINNKAYAGAGETQSAAPQKDAYVYNPLDDTWKAIADYPGNPGVISPFSFSIGPKGYVSCGTQDDEVATTYEYDPLTDKWTQKANFAGEPRQAGVNYVINNLAYCGWGDDYSSFFNNFYSYNPLTDTWSFVYNSPTDPRSFATAISVNQKVYAGLGWSTSKIYKDWWEMSTSTGMKIANTPEKLYLYPNPCTDIIYIDLAVNQFANYHIFNFSGQLIQSGTTTKNRYVNTKDLQAGSYILEVHVDETIARKIFSKASY